MAKQAKNNTVEKKELLPLEKLHPSNFFEFNSVKADTLEEIKKYPFIEIEDNKSAKEARRNRTALKSIRTTFKGERIDVTRVINSFKSEVQSKYDELMLIAGEKEDEQQSEIDRWDEIQAEEKRKEELAEEERRNSFIDKIDDHRNQLDEIIENLTFANMAEMEDRFSVIETTEFDFEEFEILFRDMIQEKKLEFTKEKAIAETNEENRKLRAEQDERNKIALAKDDLLTFLNGSTIEQRGSLIPETNKYFDSIEFTPDLMKTEWEQLKKEFLEKAEYHEELLERRYNESQEMKRLQESEKISQIQNQANQIIDDITSENIDHQIKNFNEQIKGLNNFEVAKEKATEVKNSLIERFQKTEDKIQNVIDQNAVDKMKEQYLKMEVDDQVLHETSKEEFSERLKETRDSFIRSFDSFKESIPEYAEKAKIEVLESYDAKSLQLIAEKKKIDAEAAKLIKNRKKILSGLKKKAEKYDIELPNEDQIQNLNDQTFTDEILRVEETIKENDQKQLAFKKRQKKLAEDKKEILAYLDCICLNDGDLVLKNEEVKELINRINEVLKPKIQELKDEVESF